MAHWKSWYYLCRVKCANGYIALKYFGYSFFGFSGVVAGIYTTNSPEACHYVVEDCSANVVIVENNDKLQRILQVHV
jgi:hypothetical protein